MILFLISICEAFIGKDYKLQTCPIIFYVTKNEFTIQEIYDYLDQYTMIPKLNQISKRDHQQKEGATILRMIHNKFTRCLELIGIESQQKYEILIQYWIEKQCIKRKRKQMCVIYSQDIYLNQTFISQYSNYRNLIKDLEETQLIILNNKDNNGKLVKETYLKFKG